MVYRHLPIGFLQKLRFVVKSQIRIQKQLQKISSKRFSSRCKKNKQNKFFVNFTEFLSHNSVEKLKIQSQRNKRIFRQINCLVISFVKTLLSRNFCRKCLRLNRSNFHTVCLFLLSSFLQKEIVKVSLLISYIMLKLI